MANQMLLNESSVILPNGKLGLEAAKVINLVLDVRPPQVQMAELLRECRTTGITAKGWTPVDWIRKSNGNRFFEKHGHLTLEVTWSKCFFGRPDSTAVLNPKVLERLSLLDKEFLMWQAILKGLNEHNATSGGLGITPDNLQQVVDAVLLNGWSERAIVKAEKAVPKAKKAKQDDARLASLQETVTRLEGRIAELTALLASAQTKNEQLQERLMSILERQGH